MKTAMKKIFATITLFTSLFLVSSCDNDSEVTPTNGKSQVQVEMTDAPIDNANVQGVFVTVTDIKLDGTSVEGFNSQTINLLAYQNGNTKSIGNFEIDSRSYSTIELVLDYEQEATGNSPGCYVMENNSKKQLVGEATAQGSYAVNGVFNARQNTQETVVIDFDLRKAVRKSSDVSHNSSSDYAFASNAEMTNAIRLVNSKDAGEIKGNYSENMLESSDKVIVYAYKKGQFNDSEKNPQGSNNIRFRNCVASSTVSNGSYQLSFLESGDYEVHFASYEEQNDGQLTFEGMLDASTNSSTQLNNLTVEAGASLSVDVQIIGFL